MTQGKHLVVPVSERDHSQGPSTAAVTLVQYGDYECPYTRQSTTVVRAIQQQLRDQLRFVFRNFPLTEIHPHALHAALAAEAAAAQGKFWQMHDSIFHHQHTLEDANLEQFAEAVGLDLQQYARPHRRGCGRGRTQWRAGHPDVLHHGNLWTVCTYWASSSRLIPCPAK